MDASAPVPPQPASTRKSVTGFVTKLVGEGPSYGFINDEIFFQQVNVVGGPAAVNDRVFAECEYSAHLPIKWNATSIRIVSKASGQQANPSSILESDPRKQSRQSMLNQQNFNLSPQQQQQQQQQQQSVPMLAQQQQQPTPVAPTYQQHRQQQQQQLQPQTPQSQPQPMLPKNLDRPPHQADQPPRLLDQGGMGGPHGNDFFNQPVFAQPPPNSQLLPTQPEISPFHESPMGPPKLTYTSQLGSAFVQNNPPIFMPSAPFMTQQAPMLPQQSPQQQQQQQQQQHHNNSRQQHNKNRFNNQNDKNDRQGNRNRNRNDQKFDNSRNATNNSNTGVASNDGGSNRQSRQPESRDRSANRSSAKRDDAGPKPSPVRTSTSVSSDRGGHKNRRHYDGQNIPKSKILTELNCWNIKHRCSSSIHVPSDLKNVLVNRHFRFDIKNIPKPLKFKIEIPTTEDTEKSESLPDASKTECNNDTEESTQCAETGEVSNDDASTNSSASKKDSKQEQAVQAKSTEMKLNHKYAVKVILISLPELKEIYEKVFGQQLDSYNSENRSHPRLDETLSLLCNKGPNGGHSLIGGKFDPILDGFISAEMNDLERGGRQPDLIATCRRVVMDQTGLDLSPCKSWTLLSTFIYNNKSDYFSPKASIEYSFIYLPHIWSILSDDFKANITSINSMATDKPIEADQSSSNLEDQSLSTDEAISDEPDRISSSATPIGATQDPSSLEQSNQEVQESHISLDNLVDLKVVDLKHELDRRGIKYKPNLKKAELVALLHQNIQIEDGSGQIDADQCDAINPDPDELADVQKNVDSVATIEDTTDDTTCIEFSGVDQAADVLERGDGQTPTENNVKETDVTNKRKLSEIETVSEDSSKRVCAKTEILAEKVDLIKEPFVVKSKPGQQQLSLLTLYDATQVSRYDQFELSVASYIFKESLVQHFSEYLFTALVEDSRNRLQSDVGNTGSSSSASNSQETNSDSNNNSTNNKPQSGVRSNQDLNQLNVEKVNLKELPVDRYVNLVCSFFDLSHSGHILADDLNKLFSNTDLTVSKRALVALIGDGDKFNYKTLADIPTKLPPAYIYKFPEQFTRLPTDAKGTSKNPGGVIEYQGATYEVSKLIQQVREAEVLRVNLVERFNYAIENYDKQAEEIHVLEVSQKSLSKAIKTQNDEICELKRERDLLKKKNENLRRNIKSTISSLNDLMKSDDK